jgi:hypothetical protein
MPIRRSPNGARHTPPQAGRDHLQQVVAINRNAWSQSIGISGRNHPARAPLSITDAAGDAGRTCAAVDALAASRPWRSPAARHRAGGLARIDLTDRTDNS